MSNNDMVVIPLERLTELIAIEARVDVAVNKIRNEKYIPMEELLWTLGTNLAIQTAIEIREREREEKEAYYKKFEEDAYDCEY